MTDNVLKVILMIIQPRKKAVILNGPIKFLKIKNIIYIRTIEENLTGRSIKLSSITLYCIKIKLIGNLRMKVQREKEICKISD